MFNTLLSQGDCSSYLVGDAGNIASYTSISHSLNTKFHHLLVTDIEEICFAVLYVGFLDPLASSLR